MAGLVIVGTIVIQLYITYRNYELLDKILNEMVEKKHYVEMEFSDYSAIGINATRGVVPVQIKNKSGVVWSITGYPRFSRSEYYRSPDGTIINPTSIPGIDF